MRNFNQIAVNILVGGLLSSGFFALMVMQMITSGVGSISTLIDFLSYPDNVLFCLMISVFIFASWVMKGLNNRMVLFCWSIMYVLHYLIYAVIYDYYYDTFKNVYMLALAGTAASLPVVVFMRHRVFITVLLFEQVWKLGLFRAPIAEYLKGAHSTDFEFWLKRALYVGFSVEFLYSLYMTTYGVFNGIDHNGYITEHILQNNNWEPHTLYFWLLNCIGCAYIAIIIFHLFRGKQVEDASGYGLSEEERRAAGLRLLEKYRKKARQKQQNKRD